MLFAAPPPLVHVNDGKTGSHLCKVRPLLGKLLLHTPTRTRTHRIYYIYMRICVHTIGYSQAYHPHGAAEDMAMYIVQYTQTHSDFKSIDFFLALWQNADDDDEILSISAHSSSTPAECCVLFLRNMNDSKNQKGRASTTSSRCDHTILCTYLRYHIFINECVQSRIVCVNFFVVCIEYDLAKTAGSSSLNFMQSLKTPTPTNTPHIKAAQTTLYAHMQACMHHYMYYKTLGNARRNATTRVRKSVALVSSCTHASYMYMYSIYCKIVCTVYGNGVHACI